MIDSTQKQIYLTPMKLIKNDPNADITFFASCPKGLENPLLDELSNYNITNPQINNGGVQFQSTLTNAFNVILHSGISSRIFMKCTSFAFKTVDDLYKSARSLPWDQVLTLDETFKINTILNREIKDKFSNSVFLSQKLKDGLVDNFRDNCGERPNVDTDYPDLPITLKIDPESDGESFRASILIDLAGTPLSNRGYRPSGHTAPIRENLALAMIKSTEWKPNEGEVFMDSMCGTGTILIEALREHLQVSPSYIRLHHFFEYNTFPYRFLNQSWFKKLDLMTKFEELAKQVHESNQEKWKTAPENMFFGSDTSNRALDIARESFENAFIPKNCIRLVQKDATKLIPLPGTKGIVICNPPYGERMGEVEQLQELYYNYGENLKANFKGFTAYILTGNIQLRKKISLQTSKRIPFYNGKIECRLLEYKLF